MGEVRAHQVIRDREHRRQERFNERNVSAPSEAWRFLPGASPGRVGVSHPPVSRVAPLAERREWSKDCCKREQKR